MTKKIGDKSCQSNSDKQASDFGSFCIKGRVIKGQKSDIRRSLALLNNH